MDNFKIVYPLACLFLFLYSGLAFAETKFSSKGLTWQSDDGQYKLRAGGRLHYDIVRFNEDKTSLDDESSLRRGRFYISGEVAHDWRFKVEREFTQAGKGWRNLWVSYHGFKGIRLTAGNQLAPFGMEASDSSNAIKLIERSLSSALSPSYYLGINYANYWDNITFQSGIFTDGLREGGVSTNEGDWSADTRITYAPVNEKNKTVHLGGSLEYRDIDNSKDLRIRSKPEVGIANTRLISTGRISNVNSTVGAALEAAGAYNSFLVQSEYLIKAADRSSADNLRFNGGYIQGAWVLTGEHQRYSKKSGHFKVKPKGKWGAVEIAARYSHLDLDDKAITGGKQDNYTLGLNLYVNDNARMMANYIWMDVDQNGTVNDEKPSAFLTRFQVNF